MLERIRVLENTVQKPSALLRVRVRTRLCAMPPKSPKSGRKYVTPRRNKVHSPFGRYYPLTRSTGGGPYVDLFAKRSSLRGRRPNAKVAKAVKFGVFFPPRAREEGPEGQIY